jgi:hypothetical protein
MVGVVMLPVVLTAVTLTAWRLAQAASLLSTPVLMQFHYSLWKSRTPGSAPPSAGRLSRRRDPRRDAAAEGGQRMINSFWGNTAAVSWTAFVILVVAL